MTLIVLTVVVIALLIAALAIYLLILGILLNRSAANLDDCARSVRVIVGQATLIGPAVEHLNRTGGELIGALPLLYEGAEQIISQSDTPTPIPVPAPTPVPQSVGYLDT